MEKNYYVVKREVNRVIDKQVSVIIANQASLNVIKLQLELTSKFPISEKAIRQRVDMHMKVNPNLQMEGMELVYYG